MGVLDDRIRIFFELFSCWNDLDGGNYIGNVGEVVVI